nr:AlpA family transcriptional regulator [Sphingomonas bacterium]
MTDRFLRLPDVRGITGLSRATIYRKIAAHEFPKPKSLSVQAVGWLESEIRKWVEDRAAT